MKKQDETLYTCCFIGHRTINETIELKAQLLKIIEQIIIYEKAAQKLL